MGSERFVDKARGCPGTSRWSVIAAGCVLCGSVAGAVRAADWLTYRADNARSGATSERINLDLTLHWTFRPMHRPKPAWPKPAEERHRMEFDRAYFVTAAKGLVYWGSSVDNKVTALDAATGQVRWTFATQGPVRFAPTVRQDRVYAGSDDGYVYCLGAADGKIVWSYRPGPSDRKLCGNGRMISRWPIRSDVLVDGGVAYFAAGVFPYEGIYICALDAASGKEIWKNDTTGDRSHEMTFGGITPQGYLVASDQILYVPAGRAMPVAFDKKTGAFKYVCDAGGKTGGSWALLSQNQLIAGVDHSGTPAKIAFNPRTGQRKGDAFAWFPGIDLVVNDKASYTITDDGTYAIDRAHYAGIAKKIEANQKAKAREAGGLDADRKALRKATGDKRKAIEKRIVRRTKKLSELAEEAKQIRDQVYKWHAVDKRLCCLALAGNVVLTGGDGLVTALDVETGSVIWRKAIEGAASGMAIADGRLFVSTDRGTIHCFGPARKEPAKVVETKINAAPYKKDALTPIYEAVAKRIVEETGVAKGYCLVLGCGQGRLAFELAKRTQLKIVGIEPDAQKVRQARERMEAAGLLGARVVVESWDLSTLPDYFANLLVSDDVLATGKLSYPTEEVHRLLRPFGGVVYLARSKDIPGVIKPADEQQIVSFLKAAGGAEPIVAKDGGLWAKVVRGKLDGAAAWAQQYGDTHNTACGTDQVVATPLGVLWFGEPGPELMVERHARAASPVAAAGRLFVQGGEIVLGVDAYNGTVIWKRRIPGAVRVRVDVDGGNMYATDEALYVAAEDKCYRLDPATGKVTRVFEMPESPAGQPRRWGYVACKDKALIGSAALPLATEYGALWKSLVEGGEWKALDEVPPRYAKWLNDLRAKYPVPSRLARADLQRSGGLWRMITDFPSWGSERTPKGALTPKAMVSDAIFALDGDTGQQRWVYRGHKIPHITITIAEDKIYFVENATTKEQKDAALKEKKELIEKGVYQVGDEAKLGPGIEDVRLLVALDAETGKKLWSKPIDLTGCGGDKMGMAFQDGLLCFFGHFSNHDTGLFRQNQLRWRRITTVDTRTGYVVWSKHLNYLRRPVIVGDTIIVEPRACDLHTGAIKMRTHPITGRSVPFEFLRPGHSCGITSAAPNMIFYRSYCGAIYDLKRDAGLTLFGGIRPGCWLNMIAANGLLTMPEASSGCTCSFPLRCSVALKPRDREDAEPWKVFITHGATTPVQRLGINFGAPGDRRDQAGKMWFSYPRPRAWYRVNLALVPETLSGMGAFARDYRGATVAGTDRSWLFTSGWLGLSKFELPLMDDIWSDGMGTYTLRLGFAAPEGDSPGQRVFDIKVQDRVVVKDFDIAQAAGAANQAVVKEFKGIRVASALAVELVPKAGKPTDAQAPIINFVEAVREDVAKLAEAPKPAEPVEDAAAREMLARAETSLNARRLDDALKIYHAVFDGGISVATRLDALRGMATIASPKSLSRLARYCKDVTPILRNYEDTPSELRAGSLKAYVAIASKLLGDDKSKAIRMLQYALLIAHNMSTRQYVIDHLAKAGVAIDAEPAKQGYVTRWHIIGPVPWDGRANPMDKVLVGEPDVDLTTPCTADRKALTWQRFISEQPMVDLEQLYGAPKDRAVYAYAEVILDKDVDLYLKIGSDDDFKCWFNGEIAGRFDGGRAWLADQDVLKISGKKGVNKILIKVANRGGEWALSARLTDQQDKPIHFKSK